MTYGEDGKYDAVYTYGLERIEVEDLDETRPESQDLLYYLYDGLGSVTYMVKPDGNTRDHYRYDEYGKPSPGNTKLSEDGRINLNNTFGYTGEMWDEETNLLYLRARYYEPETGRFLSRDTYEGELENPLSRNLYAYVGNNPVNRTDPSGKIWVGTTWVPSWENPKNGKLMVDAKRFAWALHLGVQNLNNGNYVVWTPAGKRYEYTAQYHGFADLFLQWNISTWHYWKIIAGDVYDGVYYGVGEMYFVGLSTGGFNHFASKGTAIEGVPKTLQSLGSKSEGYIAKRGWTWDTMKEVAENPYTTRDAVNKATGNAATTYYNKAGDYVVVDNVTGELVQTSKFGDTGWIPDSTIKNPYKP